MSADWPEVPIEKLKASSKNAIAMGPFGSRIKAENFVEDGVPVIKGGNLTGDFIVEDKFDFLTEEKADELIASNAFRRDIVITHRGTIGQVGIIPDDSKFERYVVSQSQLKVTLDQEKVNPYFIYYFLRSPVGQHRLLMNASQVGVPAIAQASTSVKSIMVPYPEKEIQNKVVEIILGLDNKIHKNRQINQTLEAMAQAIFKSWFVDFEPVKAKIASIEAGEDVEGVTRAAMRAISGKTDEELDQMQAEQPECYIQLKNTAELFPAAMQDSELGIIPEGWDSSCIGAEFDVTMGQSPPGDTYNENKEGKPFFQGRRDFGWRYPENRIYCTHPKRMAKKGDTLLSVRAPVGDINKAISDCCIGRGLASLRHKSGCEAYTYYSMMDLSRNFKSFDSEGTVFGSINQKDLKALKILKPSNSIVEEFSHIPGVIDQQILNFDIQIRILSQLRDTLLPKLLSGELSVDSIEIEEEN
ncbi:TPA: restriction endonuclease subunit S [Methanosarcinaceae archaeon]|nr:restriction endonuclease subunit S [Methanosarcinaceae archaeon]